MEALKPIFVFYTLDTCVYCNRFIGKDLQPLKKQLETIDIVFYHVEVGRSKPLDLNLYPEDLATYGKLVPAFIIVNPYSWRQREKLEAELFGLRVDEKGNYFKNPEAKEATVDNIISWTRETIRSPKITTRTAISGTSKTPRSGKKGFEFSEIY
jgi:hypothetical protein